MNYLPLTSPAKVVDWARTLITQLSQRDAQISGMMAFADDAAAGAAGLQPGTLYKTPSGEVRIKL